MKKSLTAVVLAVLTAGGMQIASARTVALGLGVGANANLGGTGVAASGSVGTGATVRAGIIAKLVSNAQERADKEITRRVNALNSLNTRVNGIVRLSASDKASLSSEIQSQITAMNTLQAQIAADAAANSTSSLKTDIQSITKSYRIFMLIIPRGALDAAADRVLDVAGMLSTLASQLQTRITAAQSAGNNMSTSASALADMNAKIADAQTQANAATTEVASLQPDNGNATVAASNTAALKSARAKVQAGQQDLVAARKDAGTIVKALLALKISASATGTVTVTSTP